MQLRSLSVDNYRSLHDFSVNLNQFNIIIGRNDAGKSNILRVAQLLLNEQAALSCSPNDLSKFSENKKRYPRTIKVNGKILLSSQEELFIERTIQVFKDKPSTSKLQIFDKGSWRSLTEAEYREIPIFYYLSPRTGALQEAFNPKIENHIYTLVKDWIPQEMSSKKKLNKLMRDYGKTKNAMSGYVKFFDEKVHGHLRVAFESDFPLLRLEVDFRSENMLFVRELTHAAAKQARVRLPVSNHGTGLVSIIALILSFNVLQEYHHQYLDDKPLLIAIEEPEVHLHPQAQRILLKYLKWISTKQQVLVTTHSPIFVDRAEPKNVLLIKRSSLKDEKDFKRKAGSTNTITNDYSTGWEGVRSALGIRLSDALMLGEINLLVEGETESILFPAMVTALVNERFIDFNSDDVFIVNGRGASLPYIAQLLQQTGKHTIVVVDDDKAGRNYKKEIEQKIGGREPKVIVLKPDIRTLPIPVCNTEECEFEDLLDSKILLLAFNEAFSGTHTPISWNDFEVAQQKLHGYRKNCSWIDTMNYLLENKPELEKDGRNFSKAKLAEKTAEYIRDGKMPVPKFCKNVISEITELISRL